MKMYEECSIFEKRKEELLFSSVEIIKIIYTFGTIDLIKFFNNKDGADIVYKYYKEGLKLISDGKQPEIIKFMLEYEKMKWIKDTNITKEDLLLITIVQGVIPYIQKVDFDGFLEFCRCIVSSSRQYGEVVNILLATNPHIGHTYNGNK